MARDWHRACDLAGDGRSEQPRARSAPGTSMSYRRSRPALQQKSGFRERLRPPGSVPQPGRSSPVWHVACQSLPPISRRVTVELHRRVGRLCSTHAPHETNFSRPIAHHGDRWCHRFRRFRPQLLTQRPPATSGFLLRSSGGSASGTPDVVRAGPSGASPCRPAGRAVPIGPPPVHCPAVQCLP